MNMIDRSTFLGVGMIAAMTLCLAPPVMAEDKTDKLSLVRTLLSCSKAHSYHFKKNIKKQNYSKADEAKVSAKKYMKGAIAKAATIYPEVYNDVIVNEYPKADMYKCEITEKERLGTLKSIKEFEGKFMGSALMAANLMEVTGQLRIDL